MVIKCLLDKKRITNNGTYPVKLRITHQRKTVWFSLGIYAKEKDFCNRTGAFYTDGKDKKINIANNNLIQFYLQKCNDILHQSRMTGEVLDVYVIKELLQPQSSQDRKPRSRGELLAARSSPVTIEECFAKCMETKSGRTLGSYKTTLSKIHDAFGEGVIAEDITEDWLNQFNRHLSTARATKGKEELDGMSVNARASHFKNLRACLNYAIERKMITQDNYPFKFFKIETEHTVKRAMKTDDLQKLFAYTPSSENETLALDISKMIFFVIGISLKDLHNLKDFEDESLSYKRAKTGRLYNIYIHPELRELLDKYKSSTGGLSFRGITDTVWLNKTVNGALKTMCEKIKIKPITTYALRHSWATYASQLGIPKDDIKVALGHGAQTVTDVYIDYDMNRIKDANRKVIDLVLHPEKQDKNKKGAS